MKECREGRKGLLSIWILAESFGHSNLTESRVFSKQASVQSPDLLLLIFLQQFLVKKLRCVWFPGNLRENARKRKYKGKIEKNKNKGK